MIQRAWGTTDSPLSMLRAYPGAWDQRKVRLFWCACVRLARAPLVDERVQRLVGLVENNPLDAGGHLSSELVAVRKQFVARHPGRSFESHPDFWALRVFLYLPPAPLVVLVTELARRMADHAARYLDPLSGPWRKLHDEVVAAERARQCHLLREIFGDPFRPVAVDPRWLTSDVRSVARGIYAERAFDGMPILADALQDAGCDAAGVLDHCREPGEHVRGCWVLDLLLA